MLRPRSSVDAKQPGVAGARNRRRRAKPRSSRQRPARSRPAAAGRPGLRGRWSRRGGEMRKIAFLRSFALLLVVVGVLMLAPGAGAARSFRVGLLDDGAFLYGNPKAAFAQARRLHVQVVRITLHWGGPLGVAQRRPRRASSPSDRAYHWQLYDRAVQYANEYGRKVMFTIVDTPSW